jgi:hypothetical protein
VAIKYAIITPTYRPHFQYIDNYLESYVRYVTSGCVPVYFVISRGEADEFERITTPYHAAVDIKTLFFEDILERFGISASGAELLGTYGRYTFQTMKKLYAMMYVDAERFLVLDCESMWVNKIDMRAMFDEFFAAPFVSGSILKRRFRMQASAFNIMRRNIDFLLGFDCDRWFLDNFVWFYDKAILSDLFAAHGSPIEMAERLFRHNERLFQHNERLTEEVINIRNGIFEIILYQNFVYRRRERYGYHFVDVDMELARALSPEYLAAYEREFYARWHGNCGLLEHATLLLTKSNTLPLAEMFRRLRFSVIRCERVRRYALQRRFMEIARPAILAASQNHAFGIHDNLADWLWLLLKGDGSMKKCGRHCREFVRPAMSLLIWLARPLTALLFALRAFLALALNAPSFLRGRNHGAASDEPTRNQAQKQEKTL